MDMNRNDQNRMIARMVVEWVVYHMLMGSRNSGDICLWQFVHMEAMDIDLHA